MAQQAKRDRKYFRGSLTKLFNKHDDIPSLNLDELHKVEFKINELESMLVLTNAKIQEDLCAQDPPISDNDYVSEKEECDDYTEKLITVRIAVNKALKLTAQSQPDSGNNAKSHLQVPKAPLPTYSGKELESIEKFFYNFESVVEKYENLTSYEKFILLQQQCEGSASILLSAMAKEKQSYTEAKTLLLEALGSKEKITHDAISKLLNLSCPQGKDPIIFVSEVRLIQQSIHELKLDMSSIIQYCIWDKLNPTLKTQFRLITNKNTPSLQEIEDNFFDAIHRYNSVNESESINKNIVEKPEKGENLNAFATSINFNRDDCVLCKTEASVGHSIQHCNKYPTAKDKLDRLKALNRCSRCTRPHSGYCRYDFKTRCGSGCGRYHFTYLCLGKSAQSDEQRYSKDEVSKTNEPPRQVKQHGQLDKDSRDPATKVNLSAAWVGSVSFDSQSILPTFTGKSDQHEFTVMADTGSQCNFLSENLAKKLNCKTLSLKNIELSGINASKTYESTEVEILLDINDKIYTIKAFVLPKIEMNLNIPNLGKIVDQFKINDYILADKKLGTTSSGISNIDMIIGSGDFLHILQPQAKMYGKSSYFLSEAGVILLGNAPKAEENLQYLAPSGTKTQDLKIVSLSAPHSATSHLNKKKSGKKRGKCPTVNESDAWKETLKKEFFVKSGDPERSDSPGPSSGHVGFDDRDDVNLEE